MLYPCPQLTFPLYAGSMRCPYLIVAIVLVGCKGGEKSLAGEGSGGTKGVKSVLSLAKDGSFSMFAANDFAAGIEHGTYSQSGDKLTLTITMPSTMVMTYKYRWIGADKVGLTADVGGAPENVLQLAGPAPATSELPGSKPGDIETAKVAAESTTCLANIKQLATGMALYAQDYDGTMPPTQMWATNLLPYTKNEWLFTCPTLRRANEQGGYALDSRFDGIKTSTIPDPRTTVMLFESTTKQIGASDAQTSLLMKPRHGDKISIGYADGHAAGVQR